MDRSDIEKKWIIEIPKTANNIIVVGVYGDREVYTYRVDVHDLDSYAEPDLDAIRNEAWEAARKINHMSDEDIKNVFGCGFSAVFETIGASEAIEKIRQHEQEQEAIQVGDEVYVEKLQGKAVVMQTGKIMCCTFQNGDTFTPHMKDCKKTGRHFPEIAEVLREMREE